MRKAPDFPLQVFLAWGPLPADALVALNETTLVEVEACDRADCRTDALDATNATVLAVRSMAGGEVPVAGDISPSGLGLLIKTYGRVSGAARPRGLGPSGVAQALRREGGGPTDAIPCPGAVRHTNADVLLAPDQRDQILLQRHAHRGVVRLRRPGRGGGVGCRREGLVSTWMPALLRAAPEAA